MVADLLSSALDELERSLPEGLGMEVHPQIQEVIDDDYGGRAETHYYLGGLRGRFRDLSNQHYRELEKELGNDSPAQLFNDLSIAESDLKKTDR